MSGPTASQGERSRELAAGLRAVRTRVDEACAAAGRAPDAVTLVVVTKFFPTADVALLAGLGVTDVGESRDQEAGPKARDLAGAGLRWHFVGRLQRNKARSVARYADVVHSVDRPELVAGLDRGAHDEGRRVGVLVQVDLDPVPDPARGGADPRRLREVAEAVAAASALDLRGVMAVAPREGDPAEAFARLAALSHELVADHPDATWVSAGMSGDLEQAVAAGATHLRVGTAIMGQRPALQ